MCLRTFAASVFIVRSMDMHNVRYRCRLRNHPNSIAYVHFHTFHFAATVNPLMESVPYADDCVVCISLFSPNFHTNLTLKRIGEQKLTVITLG